MMLDERQYRDDQPCGDRIAHPCGSWDRPRSILGAPPARVPRSGGSAASTATWKVIGGQSLMMPNRVHDGQFARFDSWQGYPQEREHLLQHIAQTGIEDVVFLSGDVHTFVAGDVCTAMGSGPPVALEFAAGSITSATVGEVELPHARQASWSPATTLQPSTPPEVMAHYRALNPWFDQLDLDRHGYGVAAASPVGLRRHAQAALDRQGAQLRHDARRPASAGRSSAARSRSRGTAV